MIGLRTRLIAESDMALESQRNEANWERLHARGRPFLKMHGLRNHFVIVDARLEPYVPAAADVERICDVQRGVGGDQLVVLEPASSDADVFMRLFNVDGREVEACGNATRCVAWLLLEESGRNDVVIETLAGLLDCRREGDRAVRCDMGQVSSAWQAIPLSLETDTLHVPLSVGQLSDGVAVNVGNPHIVYFSDDVDAIPLAELAPTIQRNALFPDQVNVGVAQVIDRSHLKLRVYERGAGLTQACGSGACAAAYAAQSRGLADAVALRVSMPAGAVTIRLSEDGRASMSGPVDYCFSGYL